MKKRLVVGDFVAYDDTMKIVAVASTRSLAKLLAQARGVRSIVVARVVKPKQRIDE